MDIKVSRPDILPEGFVGHVVVYEDENSVFAAGVEHPWTYGFPDWEAVKTNLPRILEEFLSIAIDRGAVPTNDVATFERRSKDFKQAHPCALYAVADLQGSTILPVQKAPVFLVGYLSRAAKTKAA